MQVFWRLHHAAEGSKPVFHALLAFPAALAPRRVGMRGAAAPPLPHVEHIRLNPGLEGAVVTSVPPPPHPPNVLVRLSKDLLQHR